MKVVLIYRKPSPSGHSIEELFRSLAIELRKHVSLTEYTLGSERRLVADVLALRRMKADIYHVTGGAQHIATMLPAKKTVLTVHDVGHYANSLTGFKKWIYGIFWFQLPLMKLNFVVAISERTKKDIVRHFGVDPSRIDIIENWLRPEFRPLARDSKNRSPVILQVGCNQNKNIHRLITAIANLNCELWLVGSLSASTRAQLDEMKITYRHWSNLSNQELLDRYAECDVVSLVSVFEGFGMPIIEAQAVGRPVVTSSVSPMMEVAGPKACLVDPFDVGAIRAGVTKLLNDELYRDQVVAAGLKNVSRYKIEYAVRRYLQLYNLARGYSAELATEPMQ